MIPAAELRAGASLARSLHKSAEDYRNMARRFPRHAMRFNSEAEKAADDAAWWERKIQRDRELSDAD